MDQSLELRQEGALDATQSALLPLAAVVSWPSLFVLVLFIAAEVTHIFRVEGKSGHKFLAMY
jgi:hypothetical protein